MDLKRPRFYYYRLESESSKASEEDTESICSLQDRETDIVRDTTDTDSKSDCSDIQDVYEVEYEVASLSESDNGFGHSDSSSVLEDMGYTALNLIADGSLEVWVTDGEESDNSSSYDDSSFGKTDFMTCVQCKSVNDNPLYRYCEKCFQSCRQCKKRKTYKCFPLCIYCYKDRKKYFPPRPRRNKKATTKKAQLEPPVKLDTLRSCLSGLSQDSGLGSSQECPPLDLDQIVVPDKHLSPGTSSISTVSSCGKLEDELKKLINCEDILSSGKVTSSGIESSTSLEDLKKSKCTSSFSSTDVSYASKKGRKRRYSDSSLSDFDAKRTKQDEVKNTPGNSFSQASDLGSEVSSGSFSSSAVEKLDRESKDLKSNASNSELCMFCNDAPQDGIFLHTNIAHQCCCYKCAKRTLQTTKKCPICNLSVYKVVRMVKS